jgi:hypothetical protein
MSSGNESRIRKKIIVKISSGGDKKNRQLFKEELPVKKES